LFKAGKLIVLDLEKDFSYCHAYRQDCPFMDVCKPHREVKKLTIRSTADMSTFDSQVDAVTSTPAVALPQIPGAKKAPPPPPVKKMPPPPPAKSPIDTALEAPKGVAENGTFNAPSPTPVTPAATPEQAAALQGRDVVETPATEPTEAAEETPTGDDLESMEAPQLKLLAGSMGLTFLPRARANSLRELIREARATQVPADRVVEDSREADILAEYEATEVKLPEPGVGVFEKQLEAVQERIAALKTPEPTGYELFITCAPQGRPYVTLSTLITLLSANFQEVTGVSDYRQCEYGKGPGLMAESLADELSTASGCIVVDTRTHEGAAFCVTLERFARSVVRGF
jgi:hypothetical protein